MQIEKSLIKTFYKIEVHSDTPERLRLRVRNFKLIPQKGIDSFFPAAISLLESIKGVTHVEGNEKIGSILIRYNGKVTTGTKIRAKLDEMVDAGLDLSNEKKLLAGKSKQEIQEQYMRRLQDVGKGE